MFNIVRYKEIFQGRLPSNSSHFGRDPAVLGDYAGRYVSYATIHLPFLLM